MQLFFLPALILYFLLHSSHFAQTLYYQGPSSHYKILKRLLIELNPESGSLDIAIQLNRSFQRDTRKIQEFQRKNSRLRFLEEHNQKYLEPKDETEDYV